MGSGMRWPEFSWLVAGLFSADTRLGRLYRPDSDPEVIVDDR